jgi:glycosyltransferase involved in cell wall biosynthesis
VREAKPLISIVMAVYKPNEVFLRKQLVSLNSQYYPNLELIICDDSGDQRNLKKEIYEIVSNTIKNFKWKLSCNKQNIGSNRTFEQLTELAEGQYIAYCDQDDIWEPNKLDLLYESIEKNGAILAYSDLCIIDRDDRIVHRSLRRLAPRLKHVYGDHLYRYFIKSNSVTGCTILVNSEIAKEAVPFVTGFVHDHWLALYASTKGSIAYVPKPLVRYRIHKDNQIGASRFIGINSKADYLNARLYPKKEELTQLNKRFAKPEVIKVINAELVNINQRIAFLERKSVTSFIRLILICYKDPVLLLFEFLLSFTIFGFDRILFKCIKKI